MEKAVLGIFDTPRQAELAIDRLGMMGIAQEDVSILQPNQAGTHDFAFVRRSKAPEGALTGAVVGGLVGLLLGVLVGLGVIVSPNLTDLVAAGPVLSALAAAAAIGTLLAILGAVFGLGVPEIEARHHAGKARSGGFLVAVHVRDRQKLRVVEDVLRTVRATDVVTMTDAAMPART